MNSIPIQQRRSGTSTPYTSPWVTLSAIAPDPESAFRGEACPRLLVQTDDKAASAEFPVDGSAERLEVAVVLESSIASAPPGRPAAADESR